MAHISWPMLLTAAGGCGIGVGCMWLLLGREREHFANNAVFVKHAVKLMRDKPQVMRLLGHNFEVGRASFLDGFGKMDNLNVRVKIPIKGAEDNAELYAFASKRDTKDKLTLYRLEMTFDKVPGKKLILIKANQTEEDGTSTEIQEKSTESSESQKLSNT